MPVIAGCGSYSTAAAIEMVRAAADVGADAALVVVPYYNKPSQAGLAAHFTAVAEASPLPIVVYNVPSRTVADISVETLAEIARHPKIVAIKDATGNLARVTAQRLACGEDFVQLSGNDDMALGFNAMGGVGCISVTANVAPQLCSDFQKAMREGRWDEALQLQDRLYPLHAALFTDASPAPDQICAVAGEAGLPDELRLPLVEASDAVEARRRCCTRARGPYLTIYGQAATSAVRQAEGRRREPASAVRLFRRGPVRGRDRAHRNGSESRFARARARSPRAMRRVDGEEVWLINSHIPEYSHGNRLNHEPRRPRKLLLKRREIAKLQVR